jgi:hypothetical protein
MKLIFSTLTFCFILISFKIKSQGCSDGGLCAVGALSITSFKFDVLPSEKHTLSKVEEQDLPLDLKALNIKRDSNLYYTKYLQSYFQLTSYYGLGQQATSIYTQQLEGNIDISNERLFVQLKVPYTFINGKLGSVNGLNDITLSLSYIAFKKNKSSLSLSGGVKLPTGDGNTHENGLPLPMVYQTSLGSTDALMGAKYAYENWDFTVGYQHSFNTSRNQYLKNSTISDSSIYNSYFQSNRMKRADDGLFRVTRSFHSKNITTTAGLLFIYHMANDKITDALGNRVDAVGSKGLTLNINLAGVIQLSENLDFIYITGIPVHGVDYGTDGLIRSFVFIAGIKFSIYKNKPLSE